MHKKLQEKIPGCHNFKWKEVLFLPQWDVHVIPTEQQEANLVRICNRLQWVRNLIGSPMLITSGLRPNKYNEFIGAARLSQHRLGKAIDFRVRNQTAAETRSLILPHLEELDMRMEDLPNATWVHIDFAHPGVSRYFKP